MFHNSTGNTKYTLIYEYKGWTLLLVEYHLGLNHEPIRNVIWGHHKSCGGVNLNFNLYLPECNWCKQQMPIDVHNHLKDAKELLRLGLT